MVVNIKICGIGTLDEAKSVLAAGADALGFNCVQPPSPRTISEISASKIIERLPSNAMSFLLSTETQASRIADQVHHTGANTVQILSPIGATESKRLAELIPDVQRVQVLHVVDRSVLDQIPVYSQFVHAFLLDTGRPNLAIPEYGGTGRPHDWGISAEFVEVCNLPVYLAGGLSSQNVIEAIKRVKPFGVDLCTSVRSEGNLDPQKVNEFIETVRGKSVN